MTPALYRTIILALAVVLVATAILAVFSFNSIGDKPRLSEEKRLEYEWQICDLERDLGYPACFINGEFIQVDDLDETGRNP